MPHPILRIAVPSPLRRLFDYRLPLDATHPPRPGQRYRVPFGRGSTVGILVELSDTTEVPEGKLKPAEAQLDNEPLLGPEELKLAAWAADYYRHPPGEVYAAALPVALRQGKGAEVKPLLRWRLSEAGQALDVATLKRAPRQQALLRLLAGEEKGLGAERIDAVQEKWRPSMKGLVEKGWVEVVEGSCLPQPPSERDQPPGLHDEQQAAVAALAAAEGFAPFLLDGVTGSGKTEVYLQAMARVLAAGRQVLVLVPEIGLTPQLLERFRRRLGLPIAVLHSGLAEGERLCAWQAASSGEAPVVIGTRSAVFTPMRDLGLIILDEEHDASFKQQEGFRYSARDVALVRARNLGIPVLLGSATPSLESLNNVRAGRYTELRLRERAGGARPPSIQLIDLRHQRIEEGLTAAMRSAMDKHLQAGGQVLLFLNRRGFAPTLFCHDCGWVSHCQRCDVNMTFHAGERRLRCHHCGTERPVPPQCPDCGSVDLRPLGQGTERIEQALREHFPDRRILRIDRDATRRKGSMEGLLAEAVSGQAEILIGTQMLAKGHHFPCVTLVGILDADQGLFSADFRATERMAQQILQVAGRAGRAERPGTVLIQTHQPEHPLLQTLILHGYPAFAEAALAERADASLPPYSHLALLRAEGPGPDAPRAFLSAAYALAESLGSHGVMLLGPVPAPMERRAGRHRAQLLLQAQSRAALQRLLSAWAPALEGLKEGRKVRWSLDVDPVEMY